MKHTQRVTDAVVIQVTELAESLTMEIFDGDGEVLAFECDWRYVVSDPYAVSLTLSTSSGEVRWALARDLLGEGMFDPSGDGDVHVWPSLDAAGCSIVMIELCSLTGSALLTLHTRELAAFLNRTRALVGPGTESDHLDVDAAILRVLESAGV